MNRLQNSDEIDFESFDYALKIFYYTLKFYKDQNEKEMKIISKNLIIDIVMKKILNFKRNSKDFTCKEFINVSEFLTNLDDSFEYSNFLKEFITLFNHKMIIDNAEEYTLLIRCLKYYVALYPSLSEIIQKCTEKISKKISLEIINN